MKILPLGSLRSPRHWKLLGVTTMFGCLFAYLLAMTWRRWGEPIVDLGRELYVPWQLAEGAVLYRDVYYYYGPLAAHLNALVFWVFGPSLFPLVAVNGALTLACLGLIAWEFYRQGGMVISIVCGVAFLCVFAFGHLSIFGNYNFFLPYSHELTWGFFITLGIVVLAGRDILHPSPIIPWILGLLAGLAGLTKIETSLAAGSVVAAWMALQIWIALKQPGTGWKATAGRLLPAVVSATAVIGAASAYFWLRTGDFSALLWPFNQWKVAAEGTLAQSATNVLFMGLDDPTGLLHDFFQSLGVCSAGLALIILAAVADKRTKQPWVSTVCWIAPVAYTAVVVFGYEADKVGLLLPVVALAGIGLAFAKMLRVPVSQSGWKQEAANLLWGVFALSLLLKMGLFQRIQHYGFVLAIPAFLLGVRLALKEFVEWIGKLGGSIALARAAVLFVIGSMVAHFWFNFSFQNYQAKVVPLGKGSDRLYYYPSWIHVPAGQVASLMEALTAQKDAKSLVVLPEGSFLNWASRKPSSMHWIEFTPPVFELVQEQKILTSLQNSPPDLVVVWSRNLNEFNSLPMGAKGSYGESIRRWLEESYELILHFGNDPFEPKCQGIKLFKRLNRAAEPYQARENSGC